MGSNHAELVACNKTYNLSSWTVQNAWNPISMTRAEGVYFWDADGKRYLDWSSQLIDVNARSECHSQEARDEHFCEMGLDLLRAAINRKRITNSGRPGDAG